MQAQILFANRLRYYEDKRAGKISEPTPVQPVPTITGYVPRHRELQASRCRPYTLDREVKRLDRVQEFRGDIRLDAIDTKFCNDLVLWLARQPGRHSGNMCSAQTINHVLNSLSSLLGNAVSDGYIVSNPVANARRPKIDRPERPYLESHEAYAMIQAAQAIVMTSGYRATPEFDTLIATALYTGGRMSELLSLLVSDVDFDEGLVWFRPNEYYGRRKSRTSTRSVPLWPDLRGMLVAQVGTRQRGLLFRSSTGGKIKDPRFTLETLFARAEIQRDHGTAWHLFRHTYTAHRLQTLDNGQPISVWTVARELGHRSIAQIERTYGHLLKVRHRLDRVEYRPKEDAARGLRLA